MVLSFYVMVYNSYWYFDLGYGYKNSRVIFFKYMMWVEIWFVFSCLGFIYIVWILIFFFINYNWYFGGNFLDVVWLIFIMGKRLWFCCINKFWLFYFLIKYMKKDLFILISCYKLINCLILCF